MDEHTPASTPDAATASSTPHGVDLPAAWDAARELLRAARDCVAAFAGLARSELVLARASWPWVVGLMVVMTGAALSLWLCLTTLLGWAFYKLTGGIGWALAALAATHLVAIVIARLLLRRVARNMTLPATRAEFGELMQRATATRESAP